MHNIFLHAWTQPIDRNWVHNQIEHNIIYDERVFLFESSLLTGSVDTYTKQSANEWCNFWLILFFGYRLFVDSITKNSKSIHSRFRYTQKKIFLQRISLFDPLNSVNLSYPSVILSKKKMRKLLTLFKFKRRIVYDATPAFQYARLKRYTTVWRLSMPPTN